MACRNSYNQFHGFLTERYDKEHKARLANYLKAKKSDQTLKTKQIEVFRRKIENSVPLESLVEKNLPTIVSEPKHNRKKMDSVDSRIIKVNTYLPVEFGSDFSEMRPVTPKTKRRLYHGFSKEGKGRCQYLNKRYQKIPEERFQYPILTSWDIGWRLGDYMKFHAIQRPAYCRTSVIADTFFSRNGIHTTR